MIASHNPFRSAGSALRAAVPAVALLGALQAVAAPLPGGAGSLVETYQDWVVACQAQNDVTACVMRQVHSHSQTGQHVLTAEFRNAADGELEGTLLMAFGLALAQGVSLEIDGAAGPALTFSTCLPTGCIVPTAFDAAMVDRLKAGAVLNVMATAANPPRPVPFRVSLSGFTAALNRMTELTR